MVTLSGAISAEPIVATIQTLQAAQAALATALAGGGICWQITLEVYTDPTRVTSKTTTITFNFSAADTAAILNDINNIIGNQINIQTNTLGAIA